MQIRILYICGSRSFQEQNPGRKIRSIIQHWRKIGYTVKVVYGGDLQVAMVSNNKKDYGNFSYYQKWYRRIGILDPLIRSVSEYRDIMHNEVMLNHINQVVTFFKPDLIWERSSRLHCAGLVVARSIGVPYVLEWKDNLIPYSLSWYRTRAIKMEKYKNAEADYIVVESNILRDRLSKKAVDVDKVILAHNAVDTDQFYCDEGSRLKLRNALRIKRDEVLVGYMGSYAFYHDAARLVLAADILQKKGVKKMKFLMVGAGKEYPETRRVALQRGLLDMILTMKPGVPYDDVPGILSALDIAVLPGSTDIICPIKIQEYMAAELATVAPDYACNREVISDGVTGMLFEPKNESALADKIELLANNLEMRKRIGREARMEVMRRFSWEKTWGSALEEVVRRLN